MFNNILSLCEKYGFVRKVVIPKLKKEQLKVGPVGWLLLQNLKNEWFYNIVINKDITVFFSDNNSFHDTYQFAKNMCSERLPFGIAEVVKNDKSLSKNELFDCVNESMSSGDVDFEKLFTSEHQITLKCTVFTSSIDSTPFFHQWQRQRRIWWRKFSANPGRYTMTDIKSDQNNVQNVQIMAKYPWKSQMVESVMLYPKAHGVAESEKFKNGKKNVQLHTVVSHIDMSTMFINTICDAYDEPDYKGKKRSLLRFHRKLAPYSISFAISSGGVADNLSELQDLALYVTKLLRSNHISTLFLPSSSRLSLEAQWKQYDELGIPYNILLNEKTLKDGLAMLRSRDTTLKEEVHVTELVSYVEKLFKHY